MKKIKKSQKINKQQIKVWDNPKMNLILQYQLHFTILNIFPKI